MIFSFFGGDLNFLAEWLAEMKIVFVCADIACGEGQSATATFREDESALSKRMIAEQCLEGRACVCVVLARVRRSLACK